MKDLYHRQWASFGCVCVCVCGFVPLTPRSTCLSTYAGQRSVASRRYPTHGQSITTCMHRDPVRAVEDLLQSEQSVHCCTLPHLGLPDGTHRLASVLLRIIFFFFIKISVPFHHSITLLLCTRCLEEIKCIKNLWTFFEDVIITEN